jgi:CubicO group peptidase (beta-lactamase class C family)
MARILMAIALTLALGSSAFTQVPSAISSPEEMMAAKVNQLFAQWNKPDTPGCALAIIKDGQIIYKRGYGMANLELAVPITTTSVFKVGSIAKQFTAMSIVMLAQQERVSLDDNVRRYVPEVPDFGTPITLRHLIHHTSGLRDFLEMLEMAGWRNDDVITEKDILDMVSRQRTLNHKPGDQYLYTNTGYVLLAVVVKRVTGQPLSEFAEASIFKPLGMTNTIFNDDHRTTIKGLVDAYLPKEGGGFLKWMAADDHMGSDSLFTTVEDLAQWDQNFYDKRVGGNDVIEQMLKPGVLKDDPTFDNAYGLNINQYRGLRMIHHSGSRLGYRAQLMRFPDQRFSVACLCNVRISPDTLARRVADIYLADEFKQVAESQSSLIVAPPDAARLSEKALSDVAGLYWNSVADNIRRVYVKDGKLMYFRASGNENELAPLGGNRFLMVGVRNRAEIIFRSPRPGAPLQMIYTEAGRQPVVYEPVKPASYKLQQLAEFAGQYYGPELNTTYNIIPRDEKLLFRTGNWGDYLLSPRFVDSFANPEKMGSLMFTRDYKNRVSGFVIRSGKVKNLRFVKIKD